MLSFNSDYMRGAHPLILERLLHTNREQTPGYGADPYTESAKQRILEACQLPQGNVFFMVGGTQTNTTVIDGLLAKHEGVLAAESSHINVHETGAIEATGHKVLVLPTREGKICATDIELYIKNFYQDDTYEHMVAPGMVYISYPTELGTIYSKIELEAIYRVCKAAEIPLYIDGARLGYGLAAGNSDLTLADIAHLCDVFYIGGTKVGALFGEAVVVSRPSLLPYFRPLMKQHGALLAKGRLLGLQFDVLFTEHLYERISEHAIRMAMRLKQAFLRKGFSLYIDSPSNQQFFLLPNDVIKHLSTQVSFELWGALQETHTPVRFVTDWSTTVEEIEALEKCLEGFNEVNFSAK